MSLESNIKDKKTTYSGVFLIALAILYFVPASIIQAFTGIVIWEANKLYAGGMILFGILLIVSPDTILKPLEKALEAILSKFLNKKSE